MKFFKTVALTGLLTSYVTPVGAAECLTYVPPVAGFVLGSNSLLIALGVSTACAGIQTWSIHNTAMQYAQQRHLSTSLIGPSAALSFLTLVGAHVITYAIGRLVRKLLED